MQYTESELKNISLDHSLFNYALFENAHSLVEDWNISKPFPHISFSKFLSQDTLNDVRNSFPSNDWENWHRYDNPIEDKLTCNRRSLIPQPITKLLDSLQSPEFVSWVSSVTGIEGLQADPYLHGGGLHAHAPGGKLDLHLDYSLHPISKKERRVNLIIFVTDDDWSLDMGGDLELWSGQNNPEKLEKRIHPMSNKAILFRTSDISFHGLPDPVSGPLTRRSIAVYYTSEPRKETILREKAKFFARPNDKVDPLKDYLRAIRPYRRIRPEDVEWFNEERK